MSEIRILTEIPGPRSRERLLERDKQVARGPASVLPIFVAQGDGAVLEDVDGNRFLDFAGGIGCLNVGHRPAAVTAAIEAQTNRFLHTCFTVTPYESYVRLAEILNENTPGDFPKKTFFTNSGAEAVENAIKIARAYTNRPGVICFEDGFHGRTLLALTLTSKTTPYKTGFAPFAPEVYRAPFAYCYRCPAGKFDASSSPSCELHRGEQLKNLFKRYAEPDKIAAVIFEPVLGEGGFVVPPTEFLQSIVQICREHGIVVIADEIQTGFARTGHMFASEHFGIEPDLIITGKSIAGGLPLAAVTGRADIMDAPVAGALGGTFGGNPVACEAAIAVWEMMTTQNLPARAKQIGDLYEDLTRDWTTKFHCVGDNRGLGAMRALEMVKDQATREPDQAMTKEILKFCHQRGLLVISAGTFGNVLRFHLPLVATDQQIIEGLEIVKNALEAISKQSETKLTEAAASI